MEKRAAARSAAKTRATMTFLPGPDLPLPGRGYPSASCDELRLPSPCAHPTDGARLWAHLSQRPPDTGRAEAFPEGPAEMPVPALQTASAEPGRPSIPL